MNKYRITCIDKEGDKLVVETIDGIATIKNADKFTISVDLEKIKRLVDGIVGIQTVLSDFNFKSLEIEKEE